MKSIFLKSLLAITIAIFCVLGLSKLRFETDILHVLPDDNKSVDALIDFRKHFSEDQQIVVLLSSSDENEIYEEDSASLAQYLREKMPDCKISYRSNFEENPELLAEAIASIWSHSDPELVKNLTSSLGNETYVKNRISSVIDELSSSLDQQQAMVSSYDPLGFLHHPGLRQIMNNDLSFASDTGLHRLLMVEKNDTASHSYREDSQWINKLQQHLETWNQQEELGLSFSLTGGPVFNAEIGSNMEKDMSGTLGITGGIIILLFIWFQRSFLQLVLVNTIIILTFLLTLSITGWLYGTLNTVSVGFAAILIGLVIDYVVVILREKDTEKVVASQFRAKIRPSILWAAISTALMFGALTMSSFKGVTQLAGIVAIGLLCGAFISLWLVPLYLEKFPKATTSKPNLPMLFPPLKVALVFLFTLVLVSSYSFYKKGLPQFDMKLEMLDESESQATRGYNLLKKEFSAWSDKNAILISKSDSLTTLTENLSKPSSLLEQWKKEGKINSYTLPYQLIPNPHFREKNQASLLALQQNSHKLIDLLKETGFSDKGVSLTESIISHFKPTSKIDDSQNPIVKLFYKKNETGQHLFSGKLIADTPLPAEDIEKLSQLGTELTSWTTLQSSLQPRVKHDFYWVFIPAGILLLIAMAYVFKNFKDTVLAVTTILLAIFIVNSILLYNNQSWNPLSGMSIPLIVGAGLDYSIHLIFALRRHQGNMSLVWNSIGKAICFCAISTSIGFGSLIFASSAGLRSLGLYCSLGVLITMLLSLLFIPVFWKWSHRARA